MLSRWARTWYGGILTPFLGFLYRWGFRPDAFTLAGLAAHIVAGLFLATDHVIPAAAALVLGQALDTLDGALAREVGLDSPPGAFLDSVCDHYGDLAVYLGLLWRSVESQSLLEPILILLAMFGSVFGSHVRSRAGMIGVDTKSVGLFTRFERSLVLLGGMLTGWISVALWVLAVMNNLSALQRVRFALRAAARRSQALEQ